MKIIKQSCDIFDPEGKLSPTERIEYIARVCHNSQARMKPGGSLKFLQTLWGMGHGSVFEHVYVCVPETRILPAIVDLKDSLPYGLASRLQVAEDARKGLPPDTAPINGRDFLTLGGTLEELAELPQAPASYYTTIECITDRGISHQLVRHRELSFTQASTRYINYGEDSNEPAVIEPIELQDADQNIRFTWELACKSACDAYVNLIKCGLLPEVARSVLPTAFATKLYITGTNTALKRMLALRYESTKAMEQIRKLLHPLAVYLEKDIK